MKVEIRSDNTAIIEGYVNAVERLSRPLRDFSGEQFREMVKAGTFAKAIAANPHVELYFNHMKPVGGMDTGTLELKEDNIGLYARALSMIQILCRKGGMGCCPAGLLLSV